LDEQVRTKDQQGNLYVDDKLTVTGTIPSTPLAISRVFVSMKIQFLNDVSAVCCFGKENNSSTIEESIRKE